MREYEEMSRGELVNIIESRDDEVEDLRVIIRNQEVIISDLTYHTVAESPLLQIWG